MTFKNILLEINMKKIYRKTGIRLTIILFLLILIVPATSVVAEHSIKNKQVYKVAIDKEYEPYEFLNAENKADGFIPALLKEIGKSANVSFEFIPMTWPDAINALNTNKVDLVSMIYSEERAMHYDFSQPHSRIAQALFRAGNAGDIVGVSSLAGHKIGFQENDISLKILTYRTDFKKIIFTSKLDGLLNLNIGAIDAFFCARQAGISLISKYNIKNINIVSGALFSQEFAFAAQKGNRTLIELLNTNLTKLYTNGKVKELNNKWLLQELYTPGWIEKNKMLLFFPGGILCCAFILLILWNRSLHRRVLVKTKYLQVSEEKFKAITNQATEGISLADMDGNYIFVNPSFCSMTGYTRDELLKMAVFDLKATNQAYNIFPDSKTKMHGFPIQGKLKRKDGSEFYAEITGRVIQFSDEDFVLGTVRDITERKQAEEALSESEIKYRELVENSPDAITIYQDGKIVFVNKESLHLMAASSSAELIGKPVLQLVHPDWRELVIGRMKKTNDEVTGVPLAEEKFIRLDGSSVDVEVKAMPIRFKNKPAVQLIIRDITARKLAGVALFESEERYRALVEWSPEGIAVHRNGKLLYVNPTAVRMLGASSKDELTGKRFIDLVHPDFHQITLKSIRRIPRQGIVIPIIEEKFIKVDGTVIDVEVQGMSIDYNGVLAVLSSAHDITDRKQAEMEIIKMSAGLEQRVKQRTLQLENANQELEAFSYSVSHDLRAPLRGIDGWSLALLEDYGEKLDEQGRNYLSRVRSEAQRMGNIIDDMLKLSRINRFEMKKEEVDISAIAQAIVDRLLETHMQRKCEFIIQPGLFAHCDAQMLEIALTNLISNACKFTSNKDIAKIEFGCRHMDSIPTYFIKDNGVGFDMKYAKKIFGAFQRLHKQSEFSGTGIGLATVHRIISRHGGNIWTESKPGEGASFYFTLTQNMNQDSSSVKINIEQL
jgi:PAS domain S-box-containing protein